MENTTDLQIFTENGRAKTRSLGFSLVEVMVAVGLIGIVSLGIASLLSTFKKGQTAIEDSSELNSFRDSLYTVIKNTDACKETVSGINAAGLNALANAGDASNITLQVKSGGAVLYNLNPAVKTNDLPGTLKDKFDVQSVQFVKRANPVNTTRDFGTGVATPARLLTGELRLTFMNKATHQETKSYSMPISVYQEVSSGLLKDCATINDSTTKSACLNLGGTWDEVHTTYPDSIRCVPANSCIAVGSYAKVLTSGGAPLIAPNGIPYGHTNPFTGDYTCPYSDVVKEFQSGAVTVAGDCGKYCVSNAVYPVYACMRCPAGIVPTAVMNGTNTVQAYNPGTDTVTTGTTNY